MFIFSFLVLVFQIDGMLFTKFKYFKKSLSGNVTGETSPYSFGNFRKLSLYNNFKPI